MSVAMLNLCWDIQLPHTEKLVLISLADQANDQGECWPSLASIQRRTGLCERSLQSAFKRLETRGLLRRNHRSGHSTTYVLPTNYTPASDAPRSKRTPAARAPTPASDAPPPPQQMRGTPAAHAPITIIEPSVEPSKNHMRRNFVPPTLDEVTSYVRKNRLNVDPSQFIDHYISNGWKVGRNPMKDWQAACRTWHRMRDNLPQSATDIALKRGI